MSEITHRRAILQKKSADLRDDIASAYTPIQTTLGYADYGIQAWHSVTQHPVISGGVATLFFMLIPKRWKISIIKNALPLGLTLLKQFRTKPDAAPKI